MVADKRAATPTMAGEMAVPVRADLEDILAKEERRLDREIELRLRDARQRLDIIDVALSSRLESLVQSKRRLLTNLESAIHRHEPRARLAANRARIQSLRARADSAIASRLQASGRRFASLTSSLRALSPLQVLERSYAIATRGEHVLRRADEVSAGDAITVRLARGSLDCRVQHVHPPETDGTDDET
jgi:exodeoxyribonuclease VII large subunit